MSDLAPVLQEFFTRRLISQRDASPATIAAYRDTFRLLLGFAAGRAGKAPSALGLADLDAPMITAFLEHLQAARGNSARTRNARLAAIHSLFAYAALRHPEHAALIQRVLAIPGKRRDRTAVSYLTPDEAAQYWRPATSPPEPAAATSHARARGPGGLRVSELTSLTCTDIRLQAGPHVHCTGKGRKERDTPLLPATVRILKAWLAERGGQPGDPLFPGPSGQRLSRDAVERRVKLYCGRAAAGCPSLAAKHVTVHTLRHTAAMRLLLAGVDITVIALGSATNPSPARRPTCTPTCSKSSRRSRRPPRPAAGRPATSPRTRSWNSSRTSEPQPLNYAVSNGPDTPVTRAVTLRSA